MLRLKLCCDIDSFISEDRDLKNNGAFIYIYPDVRNISIYPSVVTMHLTVSTKKELLYRLGAYGC